MSRTASAERVAAVAAEPRREPAPQALSDASLAAVAALLVASGAALPPAGGPEDGRERPAR